MKIEIHKYNKNFLQKPSEQQQKLHIKFNALLKKFANVAEQIED